jgi:hypothetical protein
MSLLVLIAVLLMQLHDLNSELCSAVTTTTKLVSTYCVFIVFATAQTTYHY